MATLEERVAQLEHQLGELIHKMESFGDATAAQPPLDSPIIWKRGQETSTPDNYTTEILSLIHEVRTLNSNAWPLYIQLDTTADIGEGCGICTRLIKSGNSWAAAYHAETFHDAGKGATIGVNIEPHKGTETGRSIGLNIQSVDWQMDGSTRDTMIDEGINIQCQPRAQWHSGIHFDQGSRGVRAIWIEGQWEVGIDVGDTRIRMNKGAELCFEETGRFYLKYNPDTGRLEFHNRGDGQDRVIGYLSPDAPEHEL